MTDSAEDRDEFLQIYLEESGEETEQLVKLLLHLEQDPDDMETLREAFRLLHTFKGSSGMMGFDRINALAHELETRFDACRSQRERMTTETVSVALRCVDFFIDFLVELADGKEDQGDPTPLIEALSEIAAVPMTAGSTSEPGEEEDVEEQEVLSPEPAQSDARSSEQAVVEAQVSAELQTKEPESKEHVPSEVGPIVATSTSPESGPVQEVTLGVRLSEGIELPDLKARLIIARLQALGDVISTEPPVEKLDQVEPPITLQIRVRSTSDRKTLANSIDLEGVAEVFIAETTPVTASQVAKERDAEQPPQPSPDQTVSQQAADTATSSGS